MPRCVYRKPIADFRQLNGLALREVYVRFVEVRADQQGNPQVCTAFYLYLARFKVTRPRRRNYPHIVG